MSGVDFGLLAEFLTLGCDVFVENFPPTMGSGSVSYSAQESYGYGYGQGSGCLESLGEGYGMGHSKGNGYPPILPRGMYYAPTKEKHIVCVR